MIQSGRDFVATTAMYMWKKYLRALPGPTGMNTGIKKSHCGLLDSCKAVTKVQIEIGKFYFIDF